MTATLTRFINPFIQYSDGNGVPLKGGKLYSYISGTDTFLNTYSDSALTVPNANPIVLNAAGYVPGAIFLGVGTYKFRLFDANGNEYPTADPVAGAQASGGTLPILSGNTGDFGKTIEVTADGSNYQLTTTLNAPYTIASALTTSGPILTIKDEGAATVANAHPFIQFGESSVVGGTQANMGLIGFSDGITSPVVFTGSGLNDAASGGTENSGRPHTYTIIIDATGTPDTFKWQIDTGSFTTGVSITGVVQTLANGVTIKFNATTGHTNGAQWTFQTGEALNIRNTISSGNINITTTGTGNINLAPGGSVLINGSPLVAAPVITGLLPTSQTFTSNVIASMVISGGVTSDSNNSVFMKIGSPSVNSLGWNITNGNVANGYQGGSTLPNNATIHFYIITNSANSFPATFASTSLTPTLPTGYVGGFYRRIFSIKTNSSGVLLPANAFECEGGAYYYWYNTSILDISTTTLGTSYIQFPLTVPSGFRIEPYYRTNTPTASQAIIFLAGDEGAATPAPYSTSGFTVAPGYDITGGGNGGTTNVTSQKSEGLTTDSLGQIGAIASAASTTLYLVTRGYKDFRRG